MAGFKIKNQTMYTTFDSLPDSSRVWIYQTNRSLTANETAFITQFLTEAISNWAAHGDALKASFSILHNRFVVLAADETYHQTSGCSLDTSSRWFKELTEQLAIDFFDRTQLYVNETEELKSFSPLQVKKEVEFGNLQASSLVFTHQVANLGFLRKNWPTPANNIVALKRYFREAIAEI